MHQRVVLVGSFGGSGIIRGGPLVLINFFYRQIGHFIFDVCRWIHKILGQFVTRVHEFIGQSDVKHIMTSPVKQ